MARYTYMYTVIGFFFLQRTSDRHNNAYIFKIFVWLHSTLQRRLCWYL